jgi:hypothetical protein
MKPDINGIAPFFIVRKAPAALSFYRDRLGFESRFKGFPSHSKIPTMGPGIRAEGR